MTRGPMFLMEPPSRLEFSNSSGGWLDCSASGHPQPRLDWHTVDGSPLAEIPGIRRIMPNGTLVILPFPPEYYRQDVHNAVYRCSATNSVGTVISKDVHVRAVVTQMYKVSVHVSSTTRGCTAILQCMVERDAKDLVKVISWVQEPSFQIYPSLQGDGKYHVLPTGELLIHNVEYTDQYPQYRCKTRHRLTKVVELSATANIRINEGGGQSQPLMLEHTSQVIVQQDEGAVMVCVAQACPAPEYRWYRSNGGYEPTSVIGGPRTRIMGPVLAIEAVTEEDSGTYRCSASNVAGQTSAEIRLMVAQPLVLELSPQLLTAPVGGTAEFRCTVSHFAAPHLITWYKDGRVLPGRSNGEVLVISGVSREDQGMYQCIARRASGDTAQASAQLQLGDAAPVLTYSFIEQTLQPGPGVSLKCSAQGNPTPQLSWLLDGFQLPQSSRFVMGQYVTVHGDVISHVNITHVAVEDGGEYTCTAENRAGKTSHSARLNIYGLPYIRPLPKVTAVAGEPFQLKCPVAGYPISEIKWEKGGRELPDDLRQKVVSNTGVLTIDPVQKAADAGTYSCWARNKQGQIARRSGEVTVIVPPRWIVEPTDVNVERNRHVVLNCQAQGVPTPSITWKKAIGSKSGDYDEVKDRLYTKLLSNGSLLLQNVKEDREGFYLCQAHNGIGNGIGKVLQLKVNSSPYFSGPGRGVTVKKGETAILQCHISGDTPITVRWLRSGKVPLTPATNYRVNVKQEVGSDGVVTAELHISGTEASDSGAYFCQASNLYGRDQQLIQLTVQEPPDKPSDLKTVMANSRSVNIQWSHQTRDSAEVTKYIVQFKESDGGSWHQVEVSGQLRGALIENLKPATRYIMRVVAEGPAGRSGASGELAIKTEPQRPAAAPINLAVRPVSSTQLLVTWSPPPPELRHGDIQGYYIGYKEINAHGANYNMTAVTGDAEDGGGELVLGGLQKFTRYSVVIQAYNQVGHGPLSEPASAQTLEDVPSMPPDGVRCQALSSQSLQINWGPPPQTFSNGIIQGYKITYDTLGLEQEIGLESRKTSGQSLILTALRHYTNYTVQVLAFTRVGDGPYTHPTYCHTDEDVPGPPADIKVVVSSSQSLLVSWLPPSQPNGKITKYTVYSRVVDGRDDANHLKRSLPSHQVSFESKNLQQHTEYQYWVSASTRIGEGISSRIVSQVPSNRVPAKISSFGVVIHESWRGSVSLPCVAVGSPKREWLRRDRQITNTNAQVLDSGELLLTNLQRADSDNYTCFVDNSAGNDKIHFTLVVQVPPSAPILYVTTATSKSMLVHWKTIDGGSATILGYTLSYRKARGETEELALSRRVQSHELKGLECGTTYQIWMTSYNKIGTSSPSQTISVRTQGQSPSVPSSNAFLVPNSTSVVLKLRSWPDSGCPILHYVVRYKALHEMEWILVSNNVKPQKKFSVTGLLSSTEYNLQVEAHNIAGSSVGEFQFYTLTKDGDLPPPELVQRGNSRAFYTDVRIMAPLLVSLVSLLITATTVIFCHRTRQARVMKETLDNEQNAEAQRERYYATIHKVAFQSSNDKIPETSEDISPYATFQLTEPGNPLLHSFMYHEQSIGEACTSVPPQGPRPHSVRGENGKDQSWPSRSVQYNNRHTCQTLQCSKVRRTRRRSNRKTDAETDDSDSDIEQITSSRTESSNQLDHAKKQGYIYHQSSTSSDMSECQMSDIKSLPRRGRQRWLAQQQGGNGVKGGMRPSPTVTESAFRCPPELSEAECDIDTLKKIKLGLRSSLWSRPQPNPQSDYSIAEIGEEF